MTVIADVLLRREASPASVTLTINRREGAQRARAPTMLASIAAAVARARRRTPARAVLSASRAPANARSSPGADIAAMMRDAAAGAGATSRSIGHETRRALEVAPPGDRAVNGYRAGRRLRAGARVRLLVASEKAVFGQPEVNLGICPGFGGTQRLTARRRQPMALELVTTGRQVKADEALRIGLANHVVPADALLDKGMELARMIAAKGAGRRQAVQASRRPRRRTWTSRNANSARGATCSGSCARPRTSARGWRRSWRSGRRSSRGR